jgi:hypothetical protein
MNYSMADAQHLPSAIFGMEPGSQRVDGPATIAHCRIQSFIRDPSAGTIFD